MSWRVNTSACPFHRYTDTYGPHTCPHRRAADRHRPPSASLLLLQQRCLPTYISSWKRSHCPHDLLFEEDLVDTRSRPSTIQLHPRETRHICWTPLEWYSVSLWMLVKIHLHVYGLLQGRINRCLTRFTTPAALGYYVWGSEHFKGQFCPAEGCDERGDTLCSVICQKSSKHRFAWAELTALGWEVRTSEVIWLAAKHSYTHNQSCMPPPLLHIVNVTMSKNYWKNMSIVSSHCTVIS